MLAVRQNGNDDCGYIHGGNLGVREVGGEGHRRLAESVAVG